MFVLILASLVGAAVGQLTVHGHDLKQIMDVTFARIDHSPVDGVVLENEWDVLILKDDADNDTCVTLTEYETAHAKVPVEVARTMYQHFDADMDQCLGVTDMQHEFHLIDHNGDNEISLHEFEQYMSHLMNQLFANGAGHGNH